LDGGRGPLSDPSFYFSSLQSIGTWSDVTIPSAWRSYSQVFCTTKAEVCILSLHPPIPSNTTRAAHTYCLLFVTADDNTLTLVFPSEGLDTSVDWQLSLVFISSNSKWVA
jgi:hypothetical protein